MLMEILNRNRLFQKLASAVLIIFFGIMGIVVVVAYSRTSGKTGMDMGKAQQMREEARQKIAIKDKNPK